MINRCFVPEIQALRIILLKFLVLPILKLSHAPPPVLLVFFKFISFHLFHIPLILYRCGTSHVYI